MDDVGEVCVRKLMLHARVSGIKDISKLDVLEN
jgi:hypothetical protein